MVSLIDLPSHFSSEVHCKSFRVSLFYPHSSIWHLGPRLSPFFFSSSFPISSSVIYPPVRFPFPPPRKKGKKSEDKSSRTSAFPLLSTITIPAIPDKKCMKISQKVWRSNHKSNLASDLTEAFSISAPPPSLLSVRASINVSLLLSLFLSLLLNDVECRHASQGKTETPEDTKEIAHYYLVQSTTICDYLLTEKMEFCFTIVFSILVVRFTTVNFGTHLECMNDRQSHFHETDRLSKCKWEWLSHHSTWHLSFTLVTVFFIEKTFLSIVKIAHLRGVSRDPSNKGIDCILGTPSFPSQSNVDKSFILSLLPSRISRWFSIP